MMLHLTFPDDCSKLCTLNFKSLFEIWSIGIEIINVNTL